MLDNRLQQAIDLYQSGKITEAQGLLRKIIEANHRNETAWLWYAYSLQSPSEKIQVLQECLKFNPDSQAAQQTLAELLEPANQPNQEEELQPIETLRSIIRKAKPYLEMFNEWFSKQEGVVKAAVISVLGLFIPACIALIVALVSRPTSSPIIIIPTAVPTPTSTPVITSQTKSNAPLFIPPTPILELLDNLSKNMSPQMQTTFWGALGGILAILGLWQIWLIFLNKKEKNKDTIFSTILIVISLFVVWQIWGWFAVLIGVVGSLGLGIFIFGLIYSAILHVPYLGGSIVGVIVGVFLSIGGCFIYFAVSGQFIQEYIKIVLIAGTSIGAILGLLFSSFNSGYWHSSVSNFQNTPSAENN